MKLLMVITAQGLWLRRNMSLRAISEDTEVCYATLRRRALGLGFEFTRKGLVVAPCVECNNVVTAAMLDARRRCPNCHTVGPLTPLSPTLSSNDGRDAQRAYGGTERFSTQVGAAATALSCGLGTGTRGLRTPCVRSRYQ